VRPRITFLIAFFASILSLYCSVFLRTSIFVKI
jgi:hypothetical protein